jgi:phosphonate transport system substrate-binding protein
MARCAKRRRITAPKRPELRRITFPNTRATAVLAAICLLAGSSFSGEQRPITLGIVMDTATRQEREPLRVYLAKAMGQPVRIVSPDTYSETVAQLGDGTFDFACLGALVYIRARAKYGVIPLVQRATDLAYHTVFITGTGSSIHSLGDLKGKQFAFGDVGSTSGYMMPYYEMKQAGIDPETEVKYRYSGSHPATAALVEDGVVEAGAIDETVFKFLIAGGKVDEKRVRVFYTSKPYVDYVYVAGKNVPVAEQQRFAHALLSLKEGKDDPILRILRAKHFVVASDQEYASMRQIASQLKIF